MGARRCWQVPEELYDDFDAARDVYGFDEISAAQQKEIVSTLKLKGTPKHLKTIDPNDPDFLKKRTLPAVPQPALVTIRPLPYQSEGFGWMCAQEASNHRGGILADEMGMGKTLQAICLVAASPAERALAANLVRDHATVHDNMNLTTSNASADPINDSASPIASTPKSNTVTPATGTKAKQKAKGKKKTKNRVVDDSDDADFTPNSRSGARKAQKAETRKKRKAAVTAAAVTPEDCFVSPSDPGCPENGPTLVVCPSSCVLQRFQEFTACTNMLAGNRSLKVLVVHSNRKKLRKRDLLTYDVVLTTYPVLQYDYAQCVNAIKVPCQYCNKMFLERKLVLHNKYFCGPTAGEL